LLACAASGDRLAVLAGRASIHDDDTCDVVGDSGRSPYARLVFAIPQGAKPA
jgi:hypothetical protein